MGRRPSKHPTEAEFEILNIIWQQEQCTVRFIYDELNKLRPTKYGTVLKHLQIMLDKGYVRRDDSMRAHVYEANIAETDAKQQAMRFLLSEVFGGSSKQFMLSALSVSGSTPDELEAIRKMIEDFEKKSS